LKKIYFAIVTILLCSTLMMSSAVQGREFPYPKVGYSADIRMDMGSDPNGRPMIMTGKVYSGVDRERREMDAFGQITVIIRRRDRGVTWQLMPRERMYIENPTGPKEDPEQMMREGRVKFTELGADNVNGARTTKYRIEVANEDGSRFDGYHWATSENIPVRMEGMTQGHRLQIDYTNIRIGKQDTALFEIPAGYQKMDLPPTFSHPMGGGSGGRTPQGMPSGGMSQEQMDQIRKQMEEMMKQMKPQ
jgi:hypothetical protein